MTGTVPLAGSEMGDLQTYSWVIVEGVVVLALVLILALVASVHLARMWRSGEQRLVFLITAAGIFAGVSFTVIATFGVTYGAFHYSGP